MVLYLTMVVFQRSMKQFDVLVVPNLEKNNHTSEIARNFLRKTLIATLWRETEMHEVEKVEGSFTFTQVTQVSHI